MAEVMMSCGQLTEATFLSSLLEANGIGARLGSEAPSNHDEIGVYVASSDVARARPLIEDFEARGKKRASGGRRSPNGNAMKKTSSRGRKKARANGLRAEYQFDYSRSRSNRFASRLGPQTVAVVLEPDVAQVFDSSRVVNKLLRSVIAATPPTEQAPRSRRKAG